MAGKSFIFRFADVEVREREFSLTKAGEVLPVEPKAFRVLLILLRNPQKLLPKDELLTAVWGDTAVSENSLARSIALLRRLLGDEARDARFIETVATVGYRWVSKVKVSEEASGEAEDPDNPPVPHIDKKKTGSRKKLWGWALAGGVLLICLVAGTAWYMHRPLPPPRITEYTQLTFDGHGKDARGTDGSRLYFNRQVFEGVWQIAVSGGVSEPVPIDLPSVSLMPMGISPDGSSMLVSSIERGQKPAQPISIVRIVGGSVRYLTDATGATWSPDAKSVVYSTADGDLNLIKSDGTGNHRLAHVGVSGVPRIDWSPDGATIRFIRDHRLWEISADGANLHELVPNWRPSYWTCCGYSAPGGEFFFFKAWDPRQSGSLQVWALDQRHGLLRNPPAEPVQLTSGPIRWGATIPSKDGKKIYTDGYTLRGELVRFNSKSGQFEPFLGGISAAFVDFSRDGKSVAYVSFPEGILWKANLDGSKPVQLTEPPMYPLQPRWSPDSSQIVFMTRPPGGNAEAYIVSSSGGSPRLLLPEDQGPHDDPNWSPDGRKIAFSNEPHAGMRLDQGAWFRGQPSAHPGVIRILDVTSGKVSSLPGSGYWSPRWSPDGRFIEAEADDGLSMKIFDLASQNSWVLQIGESAIWHVWSRDGRFIYFMMYQGHKGVFRIPLKGGKPELVIDLKDFHLAPNDNGVYYMTLDPTDAPLLLRDRGTDDLYALTLEVK